MTFLGINPQICTNAFTPAFNFSGIFDNMPMIGCNCFNSVFAMPYQTMPQITPSFNCFSQTGMYQTLPQMNLFGGFPQAGMYQTLPQMNPFACMPQYNFTQQQMFNFNNNLLNFNKSKQTEQAPSSKNNDNESRKLDSNLLEQLKKLGYDEEKGKKLAQIAKKNCAGRSYKKCATWVKKDIKEAGLGEYKSGNGCDMANAYGSNPNFKVVDASNFDCKQLPPGCIMVYGGGEAGYHKVYGHTQIMGEDGKGYSDCAVRNIKQCKKILIPV